ncbi:hypothetical protein MMC11_005966 [Xylographa trunciseda]|nr:hypothetical protein [Xylographa trunciseda]
MSLNGLDAPKVIEAYEVAVKESGGWFLLKYVTRDEIDLLRAGTGGVVELRDAVSEYEEKSPLFGFLHYRRKQVLLKYLPEGTSRLLQARLAVHLQAIIEKFVHDTIVSFANPTELSETTLSSSISQLKVSSSVKSSDSSLRTRRLAEIAEETGDAPDRDSNTDHSTIKAKSQDAAEILPSYNNDTTTKEPEQSGIDPNSKQLPEESSEYRRPRKSSASSRNLDKSLPNPPIDSTDSTLPAAQAVDDKNWDGRPDLERRQSSQSARPSAQDLYEEYLYAPKIKLGPRPSLDYSRARSSGSVTRSNGPRPVSTLPAGLHLPSRQAVSGRTQSQRAFTKPRFLDNAPMPHPSLTMPRRPATATERPTSKAGSIASVSTFVYTSEPKATTATPEKQRLMKALQMRKKQMEQKVTEKVLPEPPSKIAASNDTIELAEHETNLGELATIPRTEEETHIVHVGVGDLRDVLSMNSAASPVSVPESSLGSSTKASSLADAEDHNNSKIVLSDNDITDGSTENSDENVGKDGKNTKEIVTVVPEHPSDGGSHETEIHNELDKTTHEMSFPGEHLAHPQVVASVASTRRDSLLPGEVPLPLPNEDEENSLQPSPASTIHAPVQTETFSGHDGFGSSVPTISKEQSGKVEAGHEETKTRPSTADSVDFSNMQRNAKRRGLIDPLKTISSAEQSDENFLSDDSFMDELQSATVQQAKPISVSRSPVTPVFPLSPKSAGTNRSYDPLNLNRTISNPLDSGSPQKRSYLGSNTNSPKADESSGFLSPTRAVSNPLDNDLAHIQHQLSSTSSRSPKRRSISLSPTPRDLSDHTGTILPKKAGVSSLISQRIKALEKSSSSGSQAASSSPLVTPDLVTKHKGSFSTPGAGSSPSDVIVDGSKWRARKNVPYPTPSPSPHTNAIGRKFDLQKAGSEVSKSKSKPESISVTATIIRDAQNQKPEIPLDPSEPVTPNLHHSPLVVQQYATPSTKTLQNSTNSKSGSDHSDSSVVLAGKREAVTSTRRDSTTSRQSNSSRKDSVDLPRSQSQTSVDTVDGTKEEKKESRKTRLFKRMSAISSSSRRSIAQALGPSMKEEPIAERQEPETIPSPVSVDFGDLNIQFPDTLLWKRRHVAIDGQGFLNLSPSKVDNSSRLSSKRYHLSEFRAPYIPDQDRQELPNSVVLDFNDSSTLQCACENLAIQAQVFRALWDAYTTHTRVPGS